ncbi:Multifunctional conjugation protein TraI [Roseimaritima multifibrata]|uniref:Multifunctional conjugation protein TraI n=1 Tax=Roseimaritima multifibrata TaxID=1930274 RepID=A0A517M9D2_9BACT|nr:MobF family relaxase [Roseimaritima multifibrata]QDS91431.1 Multifunctional conjugation protein TraI [Roseimaritima multifibrata]
MRITHSKSSRDAKNYYAFSDYYDSGPSQLKGAWFGRGATMLGLEGDVEKELFDRLIDNLLPFEDKRLTQRNRPDRRVGTDITLSAPKSVSLLWGVTQDQEILQAVQDAAHETYACLEQDVQTRVNQKRGTMTLAKTGNLVGASWLHTTARPVDGHPDPQLHVHGFVLNATNTGNRWTAADLSAVVRDSGYYEAIFQSRLAGKIASIGYPVERSERDFEIAGVTRQTIEKFSRRTSLIEKLAEEKGVTDSAAKGSLGAQTRDKKSTNLVPEGQLPAFWRQRLTDEEAATLKAIAAKDYVPQKQKEAAGKAVDFATDHCFELKSVVRERELLREAIRHGIGQTSVADIHQQVANRDWIKEGEGENTLLSTRKVLAEEQALLAFARSGRGQVSALALGHAIEREWFSDEQKTAVTGLLESNDRLQILRGVAGSGKTSLMSEAIDAMKKNGNHVTVLAPTAKAAHGVLREQEGFDAETLAYFLKNEQKQNDAKHGVIWVDEAGLIGTQDLAELTRVASQIDARIILSGDSQQHQPVARGLPLRLLESDAGIKPHQVSTIRRQRGEYRHAVTSLSRGDVDAGLDQLEKLGFIKEIDDDQQRNEQLARDYADSIQVKKSCLVVAPTHAERESVTEAIRSELRSRGKITGKEQSIVTLRSKRLTEAQRGDATSYSPGDVVEFVTKGKGGYKPGDRLTIESVADGRVLAGTPDGMASVPIESPKSFDVYRPHNSNFAEGDLLRITKNRRPDRNSSAKRLNNGTVLTLKGFTGSGDLKLSNGQTVPAEWGHFDHGTTVTSYASQGQTFDRVLVAQSSLSFPASSPEQAYVSVSRGREQVTIYTDDRVALRQAVKQSHQAMNASDLIPNSVQEEIAANGRLKEAIERARTQAQRFAAKQIERIREWVSAHQPQHAR